MKIKKLISNIINAKYTVGDIIEFKNKVQKFEASKEVWETLLGVDVANSGDIDLLNIELKELPDGGIKAGKFIITKRVKYNGIFYYELLSIEKKCEIINIWLKEEEIENMIK